MATSKFGQAFAAARKSGLKTFDFGGKKYTTELAKPGPKASAPAAKARPDANYGNEGRRTAAPAAKPRNMTVAELNSKIGSKLKSTFGTQAMRDEAKKGK